MKTNNPQFKELPENTKFATQNSNNIDFIILEYYVAILIYNGSSFEQLLEPANDIEDKNNKKQMITETINIVLDFIKLNPEFAEILEQNNKTHKFPK